MNRKFNSTLFILAVLFFLAGCATKTPLLYDHPQVNLPSTPNLKIAVTRPEDERQPNKDVDKMWATDPTNDIKNVIIKELQCTGLFKNVIDLGSKEGDEIQDITIKLISSIKVLEWEIPNLEEQEGNMFAISLLTGGIGGLIYGNGETDFYGKATLKICIKNEQTDETLLDKEYSSRAEEKMARLKTDSYEERSKIIGCAVKQIMEEFKNDVKQVMQQ